MSRFVRRMAPLVALISIAGTAGAQEMDVETAVAMALRSNLGIASEQLNVAHKQLIAETWWNRFYPTTSASFTLSRANREQSTTVLAGGVPASVTLPRWSMQAGISSELILSMNMFPGVQLARLDYALGTIGLEQARREVERDVRKAFYDLVLQKQQIALTEERIGTAERRYRTALANYNAGRVDEFTMLSARVAWENQRPALTGLQTRYQLGLMQFRNQLGLAVTSTVVPAGTIDPPPIEVEMALVDQNGIERRLDIQQLDLVHTILLEQERVIDTAGPQGRYPFLRLAFNWAPTFTRDPWGDSWFDRDNWNDNGRFSITVVQPLDSLIPKSQTRNSLADAQRQIAQNRIQRDQALRGAEIQVRSLIMSINAAREQVAALESNIALARRAFELAEIGYRNGLRDLSEVQNAEVDLKDAEFQLLQQKKDIMDSLLDLEHALNTTLIPRPRNNQ